MLEFLGGLIGFWVVYAVFAGIFKHKVGLIVATILGLIAGVSDIVVNDSPIVFFESIIGLVLITLTSFLQIRSQHADVLNEYNEKENHKEDN